MPVNAIRVGTIARAGAAHRLDRGGVGEGAVLDRIDPGARRRLDAARAMGVGGDLEAERMGGGDDRAHLLVGEMRLEAARLLREHAAGGGELDHLRRRRAPARAPARRIARRRCRCCRPTAPAITSGRKPETSPWPPMIEMAGPGGDDARASDQALGGAAGEREADLRRRAEVAHRGEAGAQR